MNGHRPEQYNDSAHFFGVAAFVFVALVIGLYIWQTANEMMP